MKIAKSYRLMNVMNRQYPALDNAKKFKKGPQFLYFETIFEVNVCTTIFGNGQKSQKIDQFRDHFSQKCFSPVNSKNTITFSHFLFLLNKMVSNIY